MAAKPVLKHIEAVDKITDDFLKAIDSARKEIERKLLVTFGAATPTQIVDNSIIASGLERILIESGFYDEVGTLLNEGYQKILDESFALYTEMYGAADLELAPPSLARLETIKQLNLEEITSASGVTNRELTKAIMDYQFGLVNSSTFTAEVNAILSALVEKDLATVVATANQAFFREANIANGDAAGIEKWEYVGPDDDLTRDFCNEHIGEVKTLAEWNELDNGQLSPVSQYGGGWNCRHQLVGVA